MLEASVFKKCLSGTLATRRGLLIPSSWEKMESVQSAFEVAATANSGAFGRKKKDEKKHKS